MNHTSNISTNILRDQSKNINYIPTPNAKEIFDRIFLHNYGANRSFNLIGNYGTGKSSFLWALEKNIKREEQFFTNLESEESLPLFEFVPIIGKFSSLSQIIAVNLGIKQDDSNSILKALEVRRKKAEKRKKGLILLIDEFGKLLEYASKHKSSDDIYLLQQISEWVNNDANNTYFIITLHQNFSSYGNKLSSQEKLEWEKVKGRFVDLVFNEPVEQLIYFASKKLDKYSRPKNLESKHEALNKVIIDSNLVKHKAKISSDLAKSIYPLDWLSANVLVNALQRYGQNERSLFSFLADSTVYSINKFDERFYTVSNVYDYLVNSLPSEINSLDNAHRAQWLTTFRMLEKAELVFDNNFEIVAEVIKTISLVNLFSRVGGLFDIDFLSEYFRITRSVEVHEVINKLEKAGIIRFYKHSSKINFLEGTDLDLEQELLIINKDINDNFSLSSEILNRIEFPVLLAKRYSIQTGTNRFFEIRIIDSIDEVTSSRGSIDGYINLLFDDIKQSKINKISKEFDDNIFVLYKNSAQIRNEVLMILKFEKLIEKHHLDINALKLLDEEKSFHINNLKNLVLNQLFENNQNIWIYNGKKETIQNKNRLYTRLSEICFKIYSETPIFINELINKEFLSTPINTARKALFRILIDQTQFEELDFPEGKFPPEKAIYYSLLKNTHIHQKNGDIGYFKLDTPKDHSKLLGLWNKSEEFFDSAISNKRNLGEFYEELSTKPFKLKKGFIDFWVPIFLIAKKEDYALFHKDGSFIPFLSEDIIDLIHKKPLNFLVKSYDVSGLKLNLLESYKELVQIDTNNKGTQSTFLSIFGNFLKFQRGLNNYVLNTKKLSKSALKLRAAIRNAKDPEDALFNQFPAALGYHTFSLKEDLNVLDSFTNQIQESIREIRAVYDELLNRIEKTLLEAFYCTQTEFNKYKEEINSKIEEININSLSEKQGVFYKRVLSPLDDRRSWIKSISDVALGKSIENMIDEEEVLLMENIKDLSLGLIKATEIQNYNRTSQNEKLYSIRFFDETGEIIDDKMVVSSKVTDEYKNIRNQISKSIKSLDDNKRKEILIELLSKEMSI